MTFYPGLRDDIAAPLIAQYGQPAVYRTFGAEAYDNATGSVVKGAATDLPIQLLDLPMPEREFSEDVTAKASGMFLVEAASFAAALVTPEVDETIVLRTKGYRILAINAVAPSGEAVIYKMAVQYA